MQGLVFTSRQLKWKWLVLAKSTFLIEEGTGADIRTGLLPPVLACVLAYTWALGNSGLMTIEGPSDHCFLWRLCSSPSSPGHPLASGQGL